MRIREHSRRAATADMLSRLMRAPSSGLKVGVLLGLLMLFLVSPLAVMIWLGAEPAPAPSPEQPQSADQPMPTGPVAPTTAGSGSITVTRSKVQAPVATDLPDRPSACLVVLDRDTQQPVAGAAARRIQGGAEIAFSDERGLLPVALPRAEQLAIVADGFLLRLAPTQLGTTEEQPQRILLVRDRWSVPVQLVPQARGRQVGEAFARLRPMAAAPRPGAAPAHGPGRDDPVAERAFSEHTMLAGLPVCADQPVQLGNWSPERVFPLQPDGVIRFAVPGEYTAEVATTNGLVGSATFKVLATDAGRQQTVRIELQPGAYVRGQVVAAGTGQPVAGAELMLQGGEPLGLVGTTGADGGFRFGPLAVGEGTLHVKHAEHQPLAFGPLSTAAQGVRIELQPLPKTTLRGLVKARPDGLPVAGARIAWSPPGGAVQNATSAADGTFQVIATGTTPARLAVVADGYLPYTELVTPGAGPADYELWPASTEERLAKRLTARFSGVAVDRQGRPLGGATLRWVPATPTVARVPIGRQILTGFVLELPVVVTASVDGSFRIETTQFGPGRLCFAEEATSATGGMLLDATPGRSLDGLRLQR